MNSIKQLFFIFVPIFLFIHLHCAERSIVSAQPLIQWHNLTSDIVQTINDHLDFKSQNSYAKSCKNYRAIIKIKNPEPYLLTNINIYNQAMIYYAQKNNAEMVKYIYDNTHRDNRSKSHNTKDILIGNNLTREWWSPVTIIQGLIKIYSIQSDFSSYLDKFIGTPSYFRIIKVEAKDALYIIKLFLQQKMDVNIKFKYGLSLLHLATTDYLTDLMKELLIYPEINVNIKDDAGQTPLHCSIVKYSDACLGCSSCWHGGKPKNCWNKRYSLNKFRHLINDARIDINTQNHKGQSPLHYAICYDTPALVELLIGQSNIEVNIKDSEGNTPLHLAIKNIWAYYITKLLLAHPATNINTRNNAGHTPLDYAIKEKKEDIINLLLTCKGIEAPFFYKHKKIINVCSIAGTASLAVLLTYFILKNIYEK